MGCNSSRERQVKGGNRTRTPTPPPAPHNAGETPASILRQESKFCMSDSTVFTEQQAQSERRNSSPHYVRNLLKNSNGNISVTSQGSAQSQNSLSRRRNTTVCVAIPKDFVQDKDTFRTLPPGYAARAAITGANGSRRRHSWDNNTTSHSSSTSAELKRASSPFGVMGMGNQRVGSAKRKDMFVGLAAI